MANERSATTFDPESVPVKDASTVMLVRDSVRGVEVFLLQRVVGMDFAGGMTVFPGGGVDRSDSEASVRWTGRDVEWWAQRFDVTQARAQALVLAAVRETFEECGVLLAGQDPESVLVDTAPHAQARGQLEARELSFGDFLTREGLVLRADLLRPWARWITPLGERRRYDTHFFVAAAPEGRTPTARPARPNTCSGRPPQNHSTNGGPVGRCCFPPPGSAHRAVQVLDGCRDPGC